MNRSDEEVRGAITDMLTSARVDVRNLAIEVQGGAALVSGTVPSVEERQRLLALLATIGPSLGGIACGVQVLPVAPSDSADGRGRSTVTGTSAGSAHESRHRRDVE